MNEAQTAALRRFENALLYHAHLPLGRSDMRRTSQIEVDAARAALIGVLDAGNVASGTLQEMVEREVEKAIALGAAKSVQASRQIVEGLKPVVERPQIEVGDWVATAALPDRPIGFVKSLEILNDVLCANVGYPNSCREQTYATWKLVKVVLK